MKKKFNISEDDCLHKLLQIKRLERPDRARWAKFDHAFEAKCLLVTAERKSTFVGRILGAFTSKRLACMMATTCLIAIVAIGFERGRCCSNYDVLSIPDGAVRLAYVRDNIMCNVKNVDFKTCINHDFRGIAYVSDAISGRGAFVR